MRNIKYKHLVAMGEAEPTVEEQGEPKRFAYYEQQINAKIHHFYLSGMILSPEHYVDMIHRIKCAGPQDLINIYLNTEGGFITTGVQLIAAMRSSPAHIITHAEGEVSSLGTMIFLSGDEMVVQDGTSFMIHNHSGGQFGKGHEYLAQASFMVKWFDEIARKIYLGFLTEDEYSSMIKGEDLWFTAGEVRKRLTKYVRHLTKIQKEQEEKDKK